MGAPLRVALALTPEALAKSDSQAPAHASLAGVFPPPVGRSVLAAEPLASSRILERLARGAPLDEILLLLAREVERSDPDVLASVMLLGDGGTHLRVAAAPGLPGAFCAAIDGVSIGPQAGSCGTAAYWGERVIVGDIASDPLWKDYRELALLHGLRACWSEPICAGNGEILGTLALYYRDARVPTEAQLRTIIEAANLASIAIERQRSDERIARLTSLYRARSEFSQYVLQPTDETQLLEAICRVVVDFGGMTMAWIGRPDKITQRMQPLARYGSGLEYIDQVAVGASPDAAEGRGPGGRAFRTGECVIVNDFAAHGATGPWRAMAARYEFRSLGCVAIRRGGTVFAVLGVYSSRKDAFDSDAIGLLRQIGKDVGLALDAIDSAQRHATATAELCRSEKHFRAYFDRSLVGMAATDRDRRWIEVNDALSTMLGYSRAELLARSWPECTHPDDRAQDAAHWNALCAGTADEYESDQRFVHKDGHTIFARMAGRVVRAPGGGIDYVVLIVKDTSERNRAAQALLEKNAFLESILRSEPECVAVVGEGCALLQINEAGLRLFGVESLEQIQQAGLLGFVLPRYRRAFVDLQERVREGTKDVLEMQLRSADGTVHWIDLHATPLRDQAGQGRTVLCIARDISERKHSADVIWKQANFDMLTGLPNRYMFQDRLGQEIKKARRNRMLLGLLLIDLDHFKEINDTLGHETGDALLVAVSQRIGACVRDAETVTRLGGDEFTVILPQLPDAPAAEKTAQNIITHLAEPFQVRGESIVLSASIGITYFPSDAVTVDGLLKNADQAMYVAKRQGRNRIGYFTATLQEEAQNRLRLINDLRGALADGQFRLYFQPVVDLSTQRICGAEALLRWQHPRRGLVSPAEFVSIAEDTGLIVQIGDWAFREAALWASRWRAKAGADFCVSVNNSPVQFRDPALLLQWPQYLDSLQLPGRNMTIEITEGLLLDADDGTTSVLRRLRDSGMRISIDDFGTGYSSLSYLHKFQLDALKIDQSFVRNLQTERNARALSESIIVMGHKLGLQVVAEGVETTSQRDFLRAAGCDLAQGYLFSRPVTPEQFDTLLADGVRSADDSPDKDW